jgi:cobalt/nickel transport system permease protein
MKQSRAAGIRAAGIIALEEYAMKDSALGRIHPRVKILSTVFYMVCAASFPARELSGLAALVFYPAVLLPLADLPFKAIAKRLLPALPFALMGGISCVILLKEPALVFGNFTISVGWISFTAILLKTLLCVSAVLILIGSTPFQVICTELGRLHVPAVICVQLALCYRYIAVLVEETSAMYRAYILRTSRSALRMKDMGFFLGNLVLRSMDRAGRVYNAMKCRGFAPGTGRENDASEQASEKSGQSFSENMKARDPNGRMTARDYLYCSLVCGIALAFRFFNLPRFIGLIFRGVYA